MLPTTQIDVDPPSAPDTPSEMPGTPNSATTSLSALSTTAIKDGHRGSVILSAGHQQRVSTNTLDAERADRISRLAGLERVTTVRPSNGSPFSAQQGYVFTHFDAQGSPIYSSKISTVGSASATGSVGGNTTTWLSGSGSGSGRGYTDADADDTADRMSMDTNYRDTIDERDQHSVMDQSENGDGMSEDGDVNMGGFGGGTGSTMSGPTYTRSRASVGGMSGTSMGADTTDRILREKTEDVENKSQPPMRTPEEAGLGKSYFDENKK